MERRKGLGSQKSFFDVHLGSRGPVSQGVTSCVSSGSLSGVAAVRRLLDGRFPLFPSGAPSASPAARHTILARFADGLIKVTTRREEQASVTMKGFSALRDVKRGKNWAHKIS